MIKKVKAKTYYAPTRGRRYLTLRGAISAEAGAIIKARHPTEPSYEEYGRIILPGFHWRYDIGRSDVLHRRLCRIIKAAYLTQDNQITSSPDIEAGETYEAVYPFVITRWTIYSDGENGETTGEDIQSWRPGCHVYDNPDGGVSVAEGIGSCLFTVISVHRPGNYPERVFYTRKWKGPDGKVFGKNDLKITTTGNFRRMLKGYRYDYDIELKEVSADSIYEEKIPF